MSEILKSEIDDINKLIEQKARGAKLRPIIKKLHQLKDELNENSQSRAKLVISSYRQYVKESSKNVVNLFANEQSKWFEYLDGQEMTSEYAERFPSVHFEDEEASGNNDEKQFPTVESHTAEKLNHKDQEAEASTTNDVAGRSSQVQHDHNNLKTSDGDLQHDGCDSAEDADGALVRVNLAQNNMCLRTSSKMIPNFH